ncbi:Inactive serine protease PAMR1 [Dissostichus eleginoides]|uniref:Inactive serine protease PAMR1 n=1 Tax=Dissostichus eleginoides TaxID=100907 RepID=A0AAD9BRG1_DISEL|nr:Inactive serine protease PAMR1 [Dissostichus eleginoides]
MMMSLEFHHSCHYDYVEVRDGDSINSRVIARLCGNNRPVPVHSSGNSLHILFVSDGYKNFDGFFATFQESSACSSSPCLHDGTCILDSSYTYHCACLAGYTGKRCENVVGCRRPPVPTHGSTEGLFHHSGARITFRCDTGFELRGFRTAICLKDGTWSAPAPQCVPMERVCTLPPKPKHGDHFLVYGPNDVLIALQYMCYQPYELSGGSQRTCLPNNTWSGTPPVCTQVNNTLTEAEKDTDKTKDTGKGQETDSDKDISKTTEKAEGDNRVEIIELETTKNDTGIRDTKDTQENNNTIDSPELGKKILPTRINITQYTLYRGGEKKRGVGEGGEGKRKGEEVNQSFPEKSCPPLPRLYHGYHQLVPGMESETVEFFCNHSYALSGDAQRTCRPDGTWSGKQSLCVRACREPKVSELVKQRVLPPQATSRKTPVHKLYSSGLSSLFQSDDPTKAPPVQSQLPEGFHHLYSHIEYECVSAFYHHSGSSRRTCLKTGKWSGRHVSCSPVCGKHPTFDPRAIYRRSTNGAETKVTKAGGQAGSLKGNGGAGPGSYSQPSNWQLVCSGALVNQKRVVVAAHCVTELGKVSSTLRVASIAVHQNYDPNILDSDMAVVKLLDKARIGEKVLPLCLSESQGEEVSSEQGLVTGWSPLPDPSLGPDEKARVGLVHLADVVPCEQQYARNGVPVGVTDNMLCASQKPDYEPSNICPSDTGGILVLPALSENQARSRQNPSLSTQVQGGGKGLWRLLGLVSFGYDQGECNPDLYTVYTRVANFKDWIESKMK